MPRRRPQDHFGHKARREGFPARSVYKLEEIDRRLGLLRAGQRVLDLGAAPGSWSLYAAGRVGAQGRVLGVDKQPITVKAPANVRFVEAAIEELSSAQLDEERFDVVLSDMAPHTSGQRQRDQFLSFELYMAALQVAKQRLVRGGHWLGKIFQGSEFEDARKATAASFERVRIVKPEASRSESYEIFLAGLKKK